MLFVHWWYGHWVHCVRIWLWTRTWELMHTYCYLCVCLLFQWVRMWSVHCELLCVLFCIYMFEMWFRIFIWFYEWSLLCWHSADLLCWILLWLWISEGVRCVCRWMLFVFKFDVVYRVSCVMSLYVCWLRRKFRQCMHEMWINTVFRCIL